MAKRYVDKITNSSEDLAHFPLGFSIRSQSLRLALNVILVRITQIQREPINPVQVPQISLRVTPHNKD